jgi:phosphoserine phosphatase RsbU/P
MVQQRNARSTREINLALEKARQAVAELRSRLESGKIERKQMEQSLATFAQMIDDMADERRKLVQVEQIAKLYNVTRLIGSSLDLQTVLDKVMDALIDLTNAERGFLMLLDEDKADGQTQDKALTVKVARNLDQETIASTGFALSRTITDRVLETGQAVLTNNALEDPRFAGQKSVVDNALRSIVASPLRVRGEVIGVIYVDNRFATAVFGDDDLQLVDMFGEQAAIAIGNAIEVREREKALKEQINQLKIEVDEARKAKQVSEIVDTEYFQKLSEEAKRLRDRAKSHGADE